jgi:tripartite ATP-independent transporter DctM subunit
MASTAILGTTLVPEFEKRGYKKSMSLGPILGSGGLAMMIPPSGLAVYVAVLTEASIGRVLIGIIIPGLMMATLYASYIILRSRLQPSVAPPYHVPPTPLSKKLKASATYILPIGIIIFLVIGVIILGVATPSEAAATGAVGTYLLAALHKRLNWELIKQSLKGTLKLSVMIFMIATGAIIFGKLLALSGAARGLAQFLVGLDVHLILIFMGIQFFGFLLGMFLTPAGVVTLIVPTFLASLHTLGIDLVWFSVILVLNAEMATTSPPFGPSLYVMKGVAPKGTTLGDCYRSALPFLGCDLIVMVLLIAFPPLVHWLPQLMR